MKKPFDNKDRSRYYGLRKGDIVNLKGLDGKVMFENAEVKDYGGDNNRVYVEYETPGRFVLDEWVAEWCEMVTKVEDREDMKPVIKNADLKNADFRWYYDTTQKRHYWVLGYFGGGAVYIANAYRLAQEYAEVCGVPLETVKIDEIMRSRRFKGFKVMYSSHIQEVVEDLVNLSDVTADVWKWLQD